MIETLALFLTISYISYCTYVYFNPRLEHLVLGILFGALAGLVKITTAFPGFLVASIYLFLVLTKITSCRSRRTTYKYLLLQLLLPIIISLSWVRFADYTKSQNINAQSLTSIELRQFNFGTFSQRFESDFWLDIIFQRTILGSLGLGIGLLFIVQYFLSINYRQLSKTTLIILIAIALFLAPILVFTNLHIVHWYYQSANLIYLYFGLAIIVGNKLKVLTGFKKMVLILFYFSLLIVNVSIFINKFQSTAFIKFDESNSVIMRVADVIKANTNADDKLLVYGLDWSSELAFTSQRKSATLAPWMGGYSKSLTDPTEMFNGETPGAIVRCANPIESNLQDVDDEALMATAKSIGLNHHVEVAGGCEIWIRDNK